MMFIIVHAYLAEVERLKEAKEEEVDNKPKIGQWHCNLCQVNVSSANKSKHERQENTDSYLTIKLENIDKAMETCLLWGTSTIG